MDREAAFNRFMEHFPQDGDLTLQLLKGHLLVETHLREVFEAQLYHPKALTGEGGTQLTCHHVICITEAMTPVSQNLPWIWGALRKLNSIRNDLAHQLSPKDLNNKVEKLIGFVEEHNADIREQLTQLGYDVQTHRLLVAMLSMCTCLSALRTVVLKARVQPVPRDRGDR